VKIVGFVNTEFVFAFAVRCSILWLFLYLSLKFLLTLQNGQSTGNVEVIGGDDMSNLTGKNVLIVEVKKLVNDAKETLR